MSFLDDEELKSKIQSDLLVRCVRIILDSCFKSFPMNSELFTGLRLPNDIRPSFNYTDLVPTVYRKYRETVFFRSWVSLSIVPGSKRPPFNC